MSAIEARLIDTDMGDGRTIYGVVVVDGNFACEIDCKDKDSAERLKLAIESCALQVNIYE